MSCDGRLERYIVVYLHNAILHSNVFRYNEFVRNHFSHYSRFSKDLLDYNLIDFIICSNEN